MGQEPGAGQPRAIGRAGAFACTIVSQRLQANFGRT